MTKSAEKPVAPFKERATHYVSNAIISGVIRCALLLPYTTRVRLLGALVANVFGPLAGYRRRALENLAHVFPDMDIEERRVTAKACLNNFGRALIENYSTKDMMARMDHHPMSGVGFEAIKAAQAAGRPIILVTGHLGNYETTRAALTTHGFNFGGLYRNMSNLISTLITLKRWKRLAAQCFLRGTKAPQGLCVISKRRASGVAV